jgi:CBS-domain-containing membrane protein
MKGGFESVSSLQKIMDKLLEKTLRFDSASEPYRQRDRRLLAKLVPTFAAGGCHVVSVTDPYGHILGFLERSRYFLFEVAPQLYS